jgi:hypothetical protein
VLYIIRGASLDPDWASTERRGLTIAGRAIPSLTRTLGPPTLEETTGVRGGQ